MMIEIGKQYRTADGREARVFMIDENDRLYPVLGAYRSKDGVWFNAYWSMDGAPCGGCKVPHLVEVKPRIQLKRWMVVSKVKREFETCFFRSIDAAREYIMFRSDGAFKALVEIDVDVEEGHGL